MIPVRRLNSWKVPVQREKQAKIRQSTHDMQESMKETKRKEKKTNLEQFHVER